MHSFWPTPHRRAAEADVIALDDEASPNVLQVKLPERRDGGRGTEGPAT